MINKKMNLNIKKIPKLIIYIGIFFLIIIVTMATSFILGKSPESAANLSFYLTLAFVFYLFGKWVHKKKND